MSDKRNIIIAVAPNGARKMKSDHSEIPLTPNEIARAAKSCLAEGASMIHLHVRNPEDNSHSLSAALYQKAIAAIKQNCNDELFIQVTSEAVGIYSAEEQFEMIHELKPAAVSIGLREINGLDEDIIHDHFIQMKNENICPQIILYNQVDLDNYHDWLERKILPGKCYPILLVIGRPKTENAFENGYLTKENISKINASSWMICAFGENEFSAAKRAAKLGGNIRIGFENNSVLEDGTQAQDNAALIKQIYEYLEQNQINIANSCETKTSMTPDW